MKIETFLVIHITFSILITFYASSRKSHLGLEYIVVLLFVPLFGLLSLAIIEYMNIFDKQGKVAIDLDPINLGDDILWKPLKSFHEKGDLVPLEEAILINESKVRRRFMLETLYSDPYKYLDVLNIAKFNDDSETSHYATTTISKAQKDFQISVQKLAVEFEKHPDNVSIINQYIEILGKYIKSGLLEEHLLKNLRLVYSKALDKRLQLIPDDRTALVEKVRNFVDLQEYDSAFETSELLRRKFPLEEETWIESLRVCVEGSDSARLMETVNEILRTDIVWTKEGKERVSPWVKVVLK